MSAQYIPIDKVEWKKVNYLRRGQSKIYDYELILPRPLADWDVYDEWEKARIYNMRANLEQGQVLFDIGTESGWCNLVYADMVGAENMVLIEPTKEFWPNIYHTWYKNFKQTPKAFYDGLFSDRTNDARKLDLSKWPEQWQQPLIDRNKYQYIHDNEDKVPEITLDEFVKRSGVVPDALTMDTEGSELLILKGADKTLQKYKPLLWVSIHPDLAERDYKVNRGATKEYLESLGYTGKLLAVDHEEHWFFWPPGYEPKGETMKPPKIFAPLTNLKKPTGDDFYDHCQVGHTSHKTILLERQIGDVQVDIEVYDWREYFITVDGNETVSEHGKYCTGQDIISYCIDRQGVWEAPETKVIQNILREGNIESVVLDFGSHIGYYSLLAAVAGYRVAAFDGSKENLQLLSHSAELNEVNDRVFTNLCWLDKDAPVLPADAEDVQLVKIDVEGAENWAVHMCSDLLTNRKVKYLIAEISPTFADYYPDMVSHIIDWGYKVYQIPPTDFGEHQENFDKFPLSTMFEHCEIRYRGNELKNYIENLHQENFLFVRQGDD